MATALARRLSVNIGLDVAAAMEELAARNDWTLGEVVARAVTAYKFIDAVAADGDTLLVKRGCTIRTVTFQ